MPTYVYKCEKENMEFEVEQSIKDEALKICPTCKNPCHRLIVGTSFSLKGKGWFRDGY